jgi:hypothetical protein
MPLRKAKKGLSPYPGIPDSFIKTKTEAPNESEVLWPQITTQR